MPRRNILQDFVITINDFSGGLNTFVNPLLLQNQVPDVNGFIFDEPVGVAKKVFGFKQINNNQIVGKTPLKAIEFSKSTGEVYVVVCVRDDNTKKYEVWYSVEGKENWIQIPQLVSEYIYDMVVFEDVLWFVNNVSTPAVWNGKIVKFLDGNGVDFDNNPIANFTLPLGMTPGMYITVHQNRIIMANTIENGSEILFSRFVDDEGKLIKATSQKAWINTNQILVYPDDGEDITAIYSYLGMLCVFKQSSLYVITGELTNPTILKIPTNKGCIDKDSIDVVNNLLIYLSTDGIYAFNGREVEWISQNISSLFTGTELKRFKLKSIRISSQTDFENYNMISNFRTRGTAENSLSMPKNIVLSNSDDFYQFPNINNRIQFSDGIQLKVKDTKYSYNHREKEAKTEEGDISKVFDGNYNSFWKLRSFDQGSARLWATADASTYIDINFSETVFLKSFTVKYQLISKTSATGISGTKNGGGGSCFYVIGNEYKVLSKISVNEGTKIETKTVVVNRNVDKLYFYFGAGAYVNVVVPLPQYLDATAEVIIYEISLDYETLREPSGEYITQWIDTEQINPVFDAVSWEAETPTGTSITVYYAQSDTSSIEVTDSSVIWTQINNGSIPNITKRYFAYKIALNTTNQNYTPRLKSFRQNFSDNAVWIGQRSLIQIPTKWRNFFVSYNTNNGTLRFYLSKDGNTYTQVNNGDNIENILSGSSIVYIKIEGVRNGDDGIPQVFAIFLTYQYGEITDYVPFCGIEYNNRYFVKIYDRLIILNKSGVWSKIERTNINCFVFEAKQFLCLYNGYLGEYFNKETIENDGSLTTRTVVLGTPLESFLIRKIWLFCDSNIISDNTSFNLEIYDGKGKKVFEKSVVYNKKKNLTNPIEINCSIKCYQYYAKITNVVQDLGIIGLQFYIRPLRILSKEE